MSLVIHFVGGAAAGRRLEFPAEVGPITVGRDPQRCQVLFEADDTRVGREHCVLERKAGRYRLVLNRENPVQLDGRPAVDGMELPRRAELQLGPQGPRLLIEVVANDQLPPTADHGIRPGLATLVVGLQRSGRKLWYTAAALMVCLLLLGVWLLQQRQTLNEIEIQVAHGDALSQEQQAALAELRHSLEPRIKRIEARDLQRQAAIRTASQSVYLVLTQADGEKESAAATAWVIDREQGVMATNAHVARVFEQLSTGERMIVRSSGAEPRDYVVQSVSIHPGYEAFEDVWANYDPVLVAADGSLNTVGAAGNACDVGLLHLQEWSDLAPALPVATQEALQSLSPAAEFISIGYPLEGLALVNARYPAPKVHVGHAVALTDYFGDAAADPHKRHLVMHALPATGGASGSPLLDGNGQVVAIHSGGNVVGSTAMARIESSAAIFFAQRADLVVELLQNTAAEAQADRTDEWRADVRRAFTPRLAQQKDELFERMRTAWAAYLAQEGAFEVATSPVLTTVNSVGATATRTPLHRKQLRLAAGFYQVLALADAANSPFVFDLHLANGDRVATAQPLAGGTLQMLTFRLEEPQTLHATIRSAGGAQIVWQIVRAERKLRSQDERAQQATDRWIGEIAESSSADQVELVAEQQAAQAAMRFQLSRLTPGRYLALMLSDEAANLRLRVTTAGGAHETTLAEGEAAEYTCACAFTTSEAGPVALYFTAEPAVTDATLRLYRLSEPSAAE